MTDGWNATKVYWVDRMKDKWNETEVYWNGGMKEELNALKFTGWTE